MCWETFALVPKSNYAPTTSLARFARFWTPTGSKEFGWVLTFFNQAVSSHQVPTPPNSWSLEHAWISAQTWEVSINSSGCDSSNGGSHSVRTSPTKSLISPGFLQLWHADFLAHFPGACWKILYGSARKMLILLVKCEATGVELHRRITILGCANRRPFLFSMFWFCN